MRLILFISVITIISSCVDEDARRAFNPENAYVAFQYRPNPNANAVSTVTINANTERLLHIPVGVSIVNLNQTVTVEISVDVTEGLILDEDFFLYANAGPETGITHGTEPSRLEPLVITNDTYDAHITFFKPVLDNETSGSIVMEITAVQPDFLHMGMPGPQALRKTFTIIIEENL